jgi:hypothetical protein
MFPHIHFSILALYESSAAAVWSRTMVRTELRSGSYTVRASYDSTISLSFSLGHLRCSLTPCATTEVCIPFIDCIFCCAYIFLHRVLLCSSCGPRTARIILKIASLIPTHTPSPTLACAPRTVPARIRLPTAPSLLYQQEESAAGVKSPSSSVTPTHPLTHPAPPSHAHQGPFQQEYAYQPPRPYCASRKNPRRG